MKGLSPMWCKWIEAFSQNGHLGIKINDQIRESFITKKGLRQGDPLSPILFNIVVDMLAILIKEQNTVGELRGWFHI
jgi:hypothetical protein